METESNADAVSEVRGTTEGIMLWGTKRSAHNLHQLVIVEILYTRGIKSCVQIERIIELFFKKNLLQTVSRLAQNVQKHVISFG